MSKQGIEGVAHMLIALAKVNEKEQLDVLAQVIKTWLERDMGWHDAPRRRLWKAACG